MSPVCLHDGVDAQGEEQAVAEGQQQGEKGVVVTDHRADGAQRGGCGIPRRQIVPSTVA
jgi:hypothetical protein